jgi:enoyl-[acyl-carrier protein] reductase I
MTGTKFFLELLAVTYLNEKTKQYTQPLAEHLQAPLYLPCDRREPG